MSGPVDDNTENLAWLQARYLEQEARIEYLEALVNLQLVEERRIAEEEAYAAGMLDAQMDDCLAGENT